MKIYKTMVFFANDTGKRFAKIDTIKHEDKYWLVPEWLDNTKTGMSAPARMICLDTIPGFQVGPFEFGGMTFLNYPLPREIMDGQIPTQSGIEFVVIERPDIQTSPEYSELD